MTPDPFGPLGRAGFKGGLTLSLHEWGASGVQGHVSAQAAISSSHTPGYATGFAVPRASVPPRPALVSLPSPGLATPVPTGDPRAESRDGPLRGQRLCSLLAATAHAHPQRIALLDPPGKLRRSGRPSITWTYAAAAEIVARLANGLRSWRLPAESRIGIALPDGVEGALALLAVEAAGHVPALLPAALDEDGLVVAVQAAGISAVLTQARFGATHPAERLRRVAARYFGLRYLAAFGPDVPDGVINLDAMVLDQSGGPFAPGPGGIVSFAGGDPARPMHRSVEALTAAIAVHGLAGRMTPGERLLTLLPGTDLRGLVTGLGAALAAGASFEALPMFEAASFADALARPVATHLVVPAALEANLAASHLPTTLAGLVLVHRAPTRFPGRRLSARPDTAPVIDVVAFAETALLTGARRDGDVALILAAPERAPPRSTLMNLRRDPGGALAFRGLACHAAPLQRGIPQPDFTDIWLASPFHAPVEGARAVGVSDG